MIVGGGFGGLYADRALERMLPKQSARVWAGYCRRVRTREDRAL